MLDNPVKTMLDNPKFAGGRRQHKVAGFEPARGLPDPEPWSGKKVVPRWLIRLRPGSPK